MKGSSRKAESSVALARGFTFGYLNLSLGHQDLGHLAEAENALQRSRQAQTGKPSVLDSGLRLAFLKGDQAAMAREVARAEGQAGAEEDI